ncbi:MAG TPA: hypothetical protein VF189_05020 [Patescibacteria group bacterium]
MKKIIILFGIVILFVLTFVPNVYADNVEVAGNVNSQGTVVFKDSSTQVIIAKKDLDIAGNYIVSLPPGTYDISVISPQGSGAKETLEKNVKIDSNKVENLTVPTPNPIGQLAQKNNSTMYIALVVVAILGLAGAYIFLRKKK